MPSRPLRLLPLPATAVAMLLALLVLVVPGPAWSQVDSLAAQLMEPRLDPQVARERVYRMNREAIWLGARTRHAARLQLRKQPSARRKRGVAASAPRVVPPVETQAPPLPRRVLPDAPFGTQALPANVRANNPAGDFAGVGQSELSLGAIGDDVLVSWNDGQGFSTSGDVQGFATSGDYGATLTDGGDLPAPVGYALARWRGDPVVAVDESAQRFYIAGLAELDKNDASTASPDSSALFVARRYRTLGLWLWSSTAIPRALPADRYFLDKEWLAADSSSSNVYLIYTLFDNLLATSSIQFQRSTNLGASWSSPLTLSSGADAGDVQGGRVACGPNGEVHVSWLHNNPATGLFDIRYRRSLTAGTSFEAQQTVTSFVPHGGTGPPGFNRPRGIDMPVLAADRTRGQYRGRVYAGFAEAYDYLDDPWAAQPAASTVRFESENNNFINRADVFAAGNTLRGTAGISDTDCWSVSLTAGQHLIFWFDSTSLTAPFTLSLHAHASDTTERLAYGQGGVHSDLTLGDVMYSIYAPYSGLYFLRITSGATKPYRIRTKIGDTAGGRGRDRRDPFVCWSQGGTGGWSTPVRVNDSAVGSDDFLPEMAVGPDGCPYAIWLDARDDLYKAATHIYTTRSNNGGVSWLANTRISTASASFSTTPSNLAPNMGDYLGLAASATRMHAAWGDARGADVDAWTSSFRADADFQVCIGAASVPVLGSTTLSPVFQNAHAVYADQYLYSWSDDRGWIQPQDAFFSLGAGEAIALPIHVTVPAGATQGMTDKVCLSISNSTGALLRECCATITVSGSLVAVEGRPVEFALRPAQPNPARGRTTVRYGLPRSGRVTLAVYDVTGARVRMLVDGERPAGEHASVWDGRDDDGRTLPGGAYFSRLEYSGRRAEQRIMLLR